MEFVGVFGIFLFLYVLVLMYLNVDEERAENLFERLIVGGY